MVSKFWNALAGLGLKEKNMKNEGKVFNQAAKFSQRPDQTHTVDQDA